MLAHFTLDFPPTTGFDDSQEPTAPCGGFNPNSNNLTAWPLSGGQIALDSYHPQITLLYRAQLMGSSSWLNLTDGFVQMTGFGKLCITAPALPSNWSGKAGVIQVIGQPPDGILYQVSLLRSRVLSSLADCSALVSTSWTELQEVDCVSMGRELLLLLQVLDSTSRARMSFSVPQPRVAVQHQVRRQRLQVNHRLEPGIILSNWACWDFWQLSLS